MTNTMRVKVWAWRTYQGKPMSLLVKVWDEEEYIDNILGTLEAALDGIRQPHRIECFAVIHEEQPHKTYRESLQWEMTFR